jgi:hypothetical protein
MKAKPVAREVRANIKNHQWLTASRPHADSHPTHIPRKLTSIATSKLNRASAGHLGSFYEIGHPRAF